MPHDAAVFATSVLGYKSPADTAARVADEVKDAQAQYKRSADASYSDYRARTTGAAQEITPVITGFTPATAPAIPAGTPVAVGILGSGFTAASTVKWKGVSTPATFVNAGRINVNPASNTVAEGVPVVVTNGSLASISKNFQFTAALREAPTNSWLKADIVAWLNEHDVELGEGALSELTKAELLELVADLTDDE